MPQFLQATRRGAIALEGEGSLTGLGGSAVDSATFDGWVAVFEEMLFDETAFEDFAMRLLKAGHPPHPSAPPAPLQRPPPGHEPGICSGSRKGRLAGGTEEDDTEVAAGDVLFL